MPKPPWFPKQQPQNSNPTELPQAEATSFDVAAFDDFARTQGLTFVHWRALKCPIGVVDPDDERHPHGDHGDCSNGFIYRCVGPFSAIPSNNNKNVQVQDMGVFSQVSMMVTAERYYQVLSTAGEQMRIHLAPYDRLYLSEESITVVQWQLTETSGGPTDKMDYPIAVVENVIDSLGRDLMEGQDFLVKDGLLQWLPGGRRPTRNPDAGTNGVYGIRYRYRPYWYIASLPHEVRVSQADDPQTGERGTVVLNQQAVLQREYVFENQANDPEAKDNAAQEGVDGPQPEKPILKALGQSNLRHILAPRKGRFGPR